MTLDQLTRDSRALIMAQLLSVLLALSPSLLVDGRDVLGLGEVKHVMAGEEYNLRQQLSQVSILHDTSEEQSIPVYGLNIKPLVK